MFRRARVGRPAGRRASARESSASRPVVLVPSRNEQRGGRFHAGSTRPSSPSSGPGRQIVIPDDSSVRRGVLSREEAVRRLARAAEVDDDETTRHLDQMSEYCYVLAMRAGLGIEQAELVRKASRLHDIGKICIPRHILLKPDELTAEEFEVVKRHTEIGHRILAGTRVDWLEMGAVIALTHHEHFDGSGYPNGLSGNQIPFVGRIAAIADVFDALTSRRPYKSALPMETAIRIMREGRGTHFDPAALDLFLRSLDDVVRVHDDGQSLLVRSPRGTLVACAG